MLRIEKIWLYLLEKLLNLLRRLSRQKNRLPEHLRIGLAGEEAAYFYLRRNGCLVVAQRWSSKLHPGDLDLIAWQGPVLCFFEVKTRTARDAFPAEVMVDKEKRVVLRRLARIYLRKFPEENRPPVRFDILSVYLLDHGKKEFEHFENSFSWSEYDTKRREH